MCNVHVGPEQGRLWCFHFRLKQLPWTNWHAPSSLPFRCLDWEPESLHDFQSGFNHKVQSPFGCIQWRLFTFTEISSLHIQNSWTQIVGSRFYAGDNVWGSISAHAGLCQEIGVTASQPRTDGHSWCFYPAAVTLRPAHIHIFTEVSLPARKSKELEKHKHKCHLKEDFQK